MKVHRSAVILVFHMMNLSGVRLDWKVDQWLFYWHNLSLHGITLKCNLRGEGPILLGFPDYKLRDSNYFHVRIAIYKLKFFNGQYMVIKSRKPLFCFFFFCPKQIVDPAWRENSMKQNVTSGAQRCSCWKSQRNVQIARKTHPVLKAHTIVSL